MSERTLDDVAAEVRKEQQADDSLAQAIGYWMLREWENGLSKALFRLEYQHTRSLTDGERREAQRLADRLHHEMNRQSSNYRYRQKRIAPLKELHRELWERRKATQPAADSRADCRQGGV